ncbi:MAG: VWA domain-containing protein, partial [Phycisphaerae bacterium]|nr:VWA domain-containing protein [Phycisphaerae bacterium]NIP52542.1 VWA domain-containing protein [Phycisphaerae bacterium]NIX27598.1 VWA domain-containing protein [Phycisphaerae bacterium]
MAKKKYVSFILDETGSMLSVKDQTISGYNEYLDTLKQEKDVLFTLTKFNSAKVEVVYDAVKIKDVELLTADTYHPTATTPLYDAIGTTITSLEKATKNKKGKKLVVIQTDGLENASKEF